MVVLFWVRKCNPNLGFSLFCWKGFLLMCIQQKRDQRVVLLLLRIVSMQIICNRSLKAFLVEMRSFQAVYGVPNFILIISPNDIDTSPSVVRTLYTNSVMNSRDRTIRWFTKVIDDRPLNFETEEEYHQWQYAFKSLEKHESVFFEHIQNGQLKGSITDFPWTESATKEAEELLSCMLSFRESWTDLKIPASFRQTVSYLEESLHLVETGFGPYDVFPEGYERRESLESHIVVSENLKDAMVIAGEIPNDCLTYDIEKLKCKMLDIQNLSSHMSEAYGDGYRAKQIWDDSKKALDQLPNWRSKTEEQELQDKKAKAESLFIQSTNVIKSDNLERYNHLKVMQQVVNGMLKRYEESYPQLKRRRCGKH